MAKSRQRQAKKHGGFAKNNAVYIDERIKQIEAKIKNPEKLRVTIEKFFELTKFSN